MFIKPPLGTACFIYNNKKCGVFPGIRGGLNFSITHKVTEGPGMQYDVKNTMKEFNRLMVDIRKTIPAEYEAFINHKAALTKAGRLPEKSKWLLLLVASVS
ncbi:MAG: hypothetical protein A2X35_03545 [Elusimicrobia bacterium GWA2_61_42]|nr:MAG: hypothetical protein A2X35_03545 [Elusimicrobia bacterium GWA2_61_42]OGR77657.1 MAG: hypothetical protein A2X38_09785 [Elusimicrobia bacterium GWC2_61_25]